MVWERSYLGHVLWLGKDPVGRISLVGDESGPPKYKCTVGNLHAEATCLRKAKAWVRKYAEYNLVQLQLF